MLDTRLWATTLTSSWAAVAKLHQVLLCLWESLGMHMACPDVTFCTLFPPQCLLLCFGVCSTSSMLLLCFSDPQLIWLIKCLMLLFTLNWAVAVNYLWGNTQATTGYQRPPCPLWKWRREWRSSDSLLRGEPLLPGTGSCSLFPMGDFKSLEFTTKHELEKCLC